LLEQDGVLGDLLILLNVFSQYVEHSGIEFCRRSILATVIERVLVVVGDSFVRLLGLRSRSWYGSLLMRIIMIGSLVSLVIVTWLVHSELWIRSSLILLLLVVASLPTHSFDAKRRANSFFLLCHVKRYGWWHLIVVGPITAELRVQQLDVCRGAWSACDHGGDTTRSALYPNAPTVHNSVDLSNGVRYLWNTEAFICLDLLLLAFMVSLGWNGFVK